MWWFYLLPPAWIKTFIHISHCGYFIGYTSTTGVILYPNIYQTFINHRACHFWFDEYNSSLSIEDNNTPGYLHLQQDPESILHHLDLLNLIPFELYIRSTPFCDKTIVTYEIELPPAGKKIGFDLLDDEYFTIPCVIDTIPNSPAGHQLPTQDNKIVWIVSINRSDPITDKGALNVLNSHKTSRVKSKVNISICRSKSYQRTDLEEICSRFYQVRLVVSHIEGSLPYKPLTPNSICGALKFLKSQFWKEDLFVQYDKNKNVSLLSVPIPIKSIPDGEKILRSLTSPSIKEGDCFDAWKYFARHFENGSFLIQGINFYQSYSPVAHADSFRINISIMAMHRLNTSILDVSNSFQNKNIPIHLGVCVIPPPYYLDWFEKYYPNVPLNIDDGTFFLQCMNVIQGGKQPD